MTPPTDSGALTPAFPVTAGHQVYAAGMTLRDWFAGQALLGTQISTTASDETIAAFAALAYRAADAMLAARATPTEDHSDE